MPITYYPEAFEAWLPLIRRLPKGTNIVEVSELKLTLMPGGSSTARDIRDALALGRWRKHFALGLDWWEWSAELGEGRVVEIFADRQGPASCSRQTRLVKKMVKVPTAFDEVECEVEELFWVCPGDEAARAEPSEAEPAREGQEGGNHAVSPRE